MSENPFFIFNFGVRNHQIRPRLSPLIEMAKGQTLLLGIALIALVALVAAAPPMDKESIDKRDEAAAKMKARARTGPYPTPEEKERRKKVRVRACC